MGPARPALLTTRRAWCANFPGPPPTDTSLAANTPVVGAQTAVFRALTAVRSSASPPSRLLHHRLDGHKKTFDTTDADASSDRSTSSYTTEMFKLYNGIRLLCAVWRCSAPTAWETSEMR